MKGLAIAGALLTLYLYVQQRDRTPPGVTTTGTTVAPAPAINPSLVRESKIIPDYYYNPVPAGRYVPRDPSGIIHQRGGLRTL